MRYLIFLLLSSTSLFALSLKDPETGKLKGKAREFLTLFEVPDLEEEEVLSYLQTHWYQEGKERWEMGECYSEKKQAALPLLASLDCIYPIKAKEDEYDYALVLGALGMTMQRRLDSLYEAWEQGVRFGKVLLLTGQRSLNPSIEDVPEGLQSETELFIHLFTKHPLSEVVPCEVVDTPKKDGKRPNTETTLDQWLKTGPEPGSCLVVSSQPYVGYQEAVVRSVLPPSFSVEAVGSGSVNFPSVGLDLLNALPDYPLSIYLDNFVKWLYYEEKYGAK